jgi:hypothetical protein
MQILDDPQQRSRQGIIRWWEKRRWNYNLALIVTLIFAFSLEMIALDYGYLFAIKHIGPAMIFGLLVANIAYCGGWYLEAFLLKDEDWMPLNSKQLFNLGLAISIGLILGAEFVIIGWL